MLNPTEEVVMAMVRMSGNADWETFVEWMREESITLKEDVIHNVPDPEDINYTCRANLRRGMAITSDVIYNMISHPEDVLATMRSDVRLVKSSLESGSL